MTVGQLAIVTQGTFKGAIVKIILVRKLRGIDTEIVDVKFDDGTGLGFYRDFLRQISPLEALARVAVDEVG